VRIVAFRTHELPGVPPQEVELPAGVVALVAPDGRVRRALARVLLGDDEGPGAGVSLLPRVPDPVLARLPDGLVHRLLTGRGLSEAEPALEAGARALAWSQGLASLEAARGRLARLRGSAGPATGPGEEALLARIRELEGSPAELAALEGELRTLRGDDVEVAGDLEQATMEWLRERQDAETQLQAYRDRARELRTRLQGLDRAGTGADCPTCGRPLGEHLPRVRETLEEEWDGVVQDGSWWRRRREQLEPKPDRLQELERRALRVHATTEELGERVELARSRVRELEDLRARLAARVPEERGVGRAAWEAADRALAGAARELRARARARILDRGSGFLTRISAGRVLGMSWAEPGHLVLEGQDAPLHPPSEEDAAAALVAVRLASLELVWEASGAGGGAGLVLGEVFDRMDEAARVRAVDLLQERRSAGLSQVVVVTRGDVVDLFPEGFDAVVELRGDGSGVARLAAGMGVLRPGRASAPARRPLSRPEPSAPPPPR
jgi:hypothetical protein